MSIVNLDKDGSCINLGLFTALFVGMKLECQHFKRLANLVETGTLAHAKDFVMTALLVVVLFRRRRHDGVADSRKRNR